MEKATENQLIEFRKLLKQAAQLDSSNEYENLDLIPDEIIEKMFNNFENNLSLARNIMFNDYKSISYKEFESNINKIHNIDKAAEVVKRYIDSGKNLLCVTDNDNDGSLAQAILIEVKNIIPKEMENFDVLFAQNLDKNKSVHGITPEVVARWATDKGLTENDDFLVMTADNGIQSKEMFDLIQKQYPKATIVVTDHHLPAEGKTPEEGNKLLIVDPKYKPKGMFESDLNISGAHTLSALMRKVILSIDKEKYSDKLSVLKDIENVSNLLDFVNTDIRAYPIKIYQAETFNNLRALLNINNSVRSFVTKNIHKKDFDKLKEIAPELDIDTIFDAISLIQEQNIKASKLLFMKETFYKMSKSAQKIATEDLFRLELIQNLNKDSSIFEHFNTNYIEQLRPYIFHTLLNPNKSSYESALSEEMVSVFENLKKAESKIVTELRKVELMEVIQSNNSTILFPKDFSILKIFDRKLLMKVYNLNIKGTFIACTHISPVGEVLGSFRTIGLGSTEISNSAEELFKDFSVELRGHEKAAGILLKNKNGKEITLDQIKRFNEFLNTKVEEYNARQVISDDKKYLLVDPTNIKIVKEVNNVVRGFVSLKNKIEPLFKISRSSFFTDKDTGKEISINEMLKKHQYGYHTRIDINFHGDVIIIPQEMARQLSENNFKDYLELTYTNDGVFLANKIVKAVNVKPSQIIKFKSDLKSIEKELVKYYDEVMIPNNYEVKLDREEVKNMPFFTRNKYGLREFDRVEETILGIIDSQGLDKYVVLDVEANGLGKPQLFNFGTLDINIRENSGIKIPLKKYLKYADNIADFENEVLKGEKVRNVKIDTKNNMVIVNRELEYKLFSVLCRDTDFKLLDKLTYLTHISQATLNKYGMKTSELDKMLAERYGVGKYTFGAHNSMYDYNVVSVNLPKFYELSLKDNYILDTAKFAKSDTLGFADLKITLIHPKYNEALFFNHPFADFSLTSILKSNEDFLYPSIRNDFILKRRSGVLFLIDKRDNTEEELPETTDDILKTMANVPMPLNRVKYAVQFLLQYENIRGMLLHDIKDKVKVIEPSEAVANLGLTDLYKEFCKGFNFEGDIEKNLLNFSKFLKYNLREDEYNLFNEKIFNNKDSDEILLKGLSEQNAKNASLEKGKTGELIKLEKAFTKKNSKMTQEEYEEKKEEIMDRYDKKMFKFTNYDLFTDDVIKFLEENKRIYLKYTNNWEYRLLLSCYDPIKPTINKDELQITHYKTSLPKERIKEMVKEIYDYKKKIGIEKESFYVHEKHYNMGVDGDAAIEFILIMQRACAKHYNRYGANDYNGVVNMVNQATLETTYQAKRKYYFENVLKRCNIGSGSYKQMALAFNSRQDTDGNKHSAEVIEIAKSAEKIQLQSKLLSAGLNILADNKLTDVGYDNLKEIQKDIDFLISYSLLKNSLSDSKYKVVNIDGLVKSFIEKENQTDFYDTYQADVAANLNNYAEYTDEQKELLKSIEQIVSHYTEINSEHKKSFLEILENLDPVFSEKFKKVYDTIGFFYVTREEQEMKKVIDQIFDSAISGEYLLKKDVGYITEEQKIVIIDLANDIFQKVDDLNKFTHAKPIDIDLKVKLLNGIEDIPAIDDLLTQKRDEMKSVMESSEINYKKINETFIMNIVKLNPEKEFLNYTELNRELLKRKLTTEFSLELYTKNVEKDITPSKRKDNNPLRKN